MKTLVVSYLPRGERSHTGKLLNAFLANVSDTEIEHLDLLEQTPDLLDAQRVSAYIRRNYLGETLSAEDQQSMATLDAMTEQFVAADAVVFAFPMYNFSFPATVKAFFDGILQKGKTWDMGEAGFVGLQTGKKALLLLSSGGIYEGDFAPYEHAVSLWRTEMGLMGITDPEVVTTSGTNMLSPEDLAQAEAVAAEKVGEIAASWS